MNSNCRTISCRIVSHWNLLPATKLELNDSMAYLNRSSEQTDKKQTHQYIGGKDGQHCAVDSGHHFGFNTIGSSPPPIAYGTTLPKDIPAKRFQILDIFCSLACQLSPTLPRLPVLSFPPPAPSPPAVSCTHSFPLSVFPLPSPSLLHPPYPLSPNFLPSLTSPRAIHSLLPLPSFWHLNVNFSFTSSVKE